MWIPIIQGLSEQLVSQDGSQVSGHDGLLLHGAVVLQGQDQGVRRRLGDGDDGAKSERKGKEGIEIICVCIFS